MTRTLIALADGQRALILANEGTDFAPRLSVVSAEEIDNPPARTQGADRAGRNNDGRAGGARKSAFDETDFHALTKERFAKEFVERLNRAAATKAFDRIAIFAPPAALGAMRAHYAPALKARLIGEIAEDLTRHPVADIERHVAHALKGA
jgi:protein required for attachment to host cells